MEILSIIVPLALLYFLFSWIYSIKIHTEQQVKQNEQMLELLKEINGKLHKE